MRRIRVGVVFGGRSGEHEVSIASAAYVIGALDSDRYDAVPIGITRAGQWLIAESPDKLLDLEATPQVSDGNGAANDTSHFDLVRGGGSPGVLPQEAAVDVIFPVLHGPYGEDGTVQGVFETVNLPYVGSGVRASAVCMDKVDMKRMLAEAGLPGVKYCLVRRADWRRDPDRVLEDVESALPYPMFVKPSNLGSSVGISKAHARQDLSEALDLAARFDRRLIVEQGIDAREVECSVLGNDEPLVSVPGEVVSTHEFYDYEAKYTEGLADLKIPARISPEQTRRVQELARLAFLAVDAAGLARVDFFVRRSDGEILINEINTMPGFTATSMYPKLWEATGVSNADLVERLIQLALERHEENQDRSVTR